MENDITKKLEESNRSKYGDKDYDQISQNYRISKDRGDVWCSENINRYLSRFTRPNSSKKDNLTDLYKAKDYLQRMIEVNEGILGTDNREEVIENFKSKQDGEEE